MGRRTVVATFATAATSLILAQAASAHAVHTTVPGESLSSVAAANGTTVEALAAANGLSSEASLAVGQELTIPRSPPPPTPDPATAAAQGMVPVHHPSAAPYLAPEAAAAWEAMRQEALASYGVDLYPAGSLSGYRTYEQQAALHELYLAGLGEPASPPGGSSHESGNAVDLATPQMREVVDEIGATYGWAKVEAPSEWWHVNYVGGYGD